MPVLTRARVRELLQLALPIVIVQVGLMAMGVIDTVMVGHLSAEALGAVALGNIYFFGTSIFGMGTLLALDPLAAQAVGAGDSEGVARAIQRGLILVAALCVPVTLLLLPAGPVLRVLGQPEALVVLAAPFCVIGIAGLPGFFAFVVLRQGLQAQGRVAAIIVSVVLANLANVFFNWVFIFGHLGSRPLGVIGSAWATVIGRTLLPLLLLAFDWGHLRNQLRPWRSGILDPVPLARMLKLGAPIGFQHQLEYGVFGVVGLLMARLGEAEIAGHQIALNLASVTFMVPLGLSSAAAVLVGRAVGVLDRPRVIESAAAALACGLLFMAAMAVVFLTLPGTLAAIYTNDQAVRAVAVLLIPLAGIFQVFDGLQVVSIGILRGMGDTRAPMVINILGFWMIGLPVGLWLAFHLGMRAPGLWWGLVIGLIGVGGALAGRVRWRLAQPIGRLEVERSAA
ncbi:MAG TPA: MATE family efflux transporter [Gemmatimonadales bacterium]|nr:MATE family efflux transporter [Gemmatimonadales bacterium]